MSDLTGGAGNGRASSSGARAQTGPVPVSQMPQSSQQSKLTTPTDIMRRRREREEARLQAEAASAAAAALAQTRPGSNRLSMPPASRPPDRPLPETSSAIPSARPHRRSESAAQAPARISDPASQDTPTRLSAAAPAVSSTNIPPAARPPIPAAEPSNVPRPRPSTQSQGQPRPVPAAAPAASASASRRTQPQQVPQSSTEAGRPRPAAPAVQPPSGPQTAASTFPHAFERWETLSSHWEGLTSYWIRKLEQNTKELEREPLLQQLSRQVTDLSAAGANLFHAVVELQRLRASSERKFQRWFHETRKDAERQKEEAAQFERAFLGERGARASDIQVMQAELDAAHAAVARLEKQHSDMQREQQISKDEARRAWEELGRREQEAREQVAALREGQPIVIGGMQVFPTAHGTSLDRLHHDAQMQPEMYGHTDTRGSPTNTDPFTETRPTVTGPLRSNAPQSGYVPAAADPTSDSSFYQHPASYLHSTPEPQVVPGTASGGHNAFVTEEDDDDFDNDGHPLVRYNTQGQPILEQQSQGSYPSSPEQERKRRSRQDTTSSSTVSYPAIPAPTSGRIEPISAPTTLPPPAPFAPPPPVPQPVASAASFAQTIPAADYEGAGYEDYDTTQINSRLSVVDEVDEEASRGSVVSTQHPPAAPF